MINLDDRELISKYDKSDQLGSMAKWGDFILEAREESNKLLIPEKITWGQNEIKYEKPSNIVICGMGGSAIAGDYFKSLFEKELSIPVSVNREYNLPNYVNHSTLVICVSYSGNTEETLTQYLEALKKRAMIISISSKGLLERFSKQVGTPHIKIREGIPPRTAFSLMYIALLTIFEKLKIIANMDVQIKDASQTIKDLRKQYSQVIPTKENIAKEMSYNLFNTLPIFISHGVYSPIANRAKSQLNENSKTIALGEVLPEQNHNGIVIFDNPTSVLNDVAFIFIRSENEENALRIRIEEVIKMANVKTEKILEIRPQGQTDLAKQLSLTYLIDFISIYLGILNKVDPSTTPSIDKLKSVLKKKLNLQELIEREILD